MPNIDPAMFNPLAQSPTLFIVVNLAVALGLIGFMYRQQRRDAKFTVRVLTDKREDKAADVHLLAQKNSTALSSAVMPSENEATSTGFVQ